MADPELVRELIERNIVSLRGRLQAHIQIEESGCHVWTGTIVHNGYGRMYLGWVKGKVVMIRVHRLTWMLENGAIPHGFVTDHLCRNRRCCNVQHMELVTTGENNRRASRVRTLSTHCRAGHLYDADNTVTRRGRRYCRACSGLHHEPKYWAERTHCIRGHPFDVENTRHANGIRYCRACARIRKRKPRTKKAPQQQG